MTSADSKMLEQIQKSLMEFKDSLTTEIHKISLDMAEVKAELTNIKQSSEARLSRLETQAEANNNAIQSVKDTIHAIDKRLTRQENLPEEVSKQRHRINEIDQRVVIIEQGFKDVDVLKALTGENSKKLSNQDAVISFVTSKPFIAVAGFLIAILLSKYGIAV